MSENNNTGNIGTTVTYDSPHALDVAQAYQRN